MKKLIYSDYNFWLNIVYVEFVIFTHLALAVSYYFFNPEDKHSKKRFHPNFSIIYYFSL